MVGGVKAVLKAVGIRVKERNRGAAVVKVADGAVEATKWIANRQRN